MKNIFKKFYINLNDIIALVLTLFLVLYFSQVERLIDVLMNYLFYLVLFAIFLLISGWFWFMFRKNDVSLLKFIRRLIANYCYTVFMVYCFLGSYFLVLSFIS